MMVERTEQTMTDTAPSLTQALLDRLKPVPIMPVLSLPSVEAGLRIAEALQRAGITVLEITLRTQAALVAIEAIARELPGCMVGAGTLRTADHMRQVVNAGASFAVSPGATDTLLSAGAETGIPFLPGVGSVSEAMRAREHGFSVLKLFPAEAIGGVRLLKSIHAPLPDLSFCPTGGINAENAHLYLALPNVIAVGGSWMVPDAMVMAEDWTGIERLANQAVASITA